MTKPLALIVEDQANLALLYEDALRLVGYDIFAISDGLEALNHLTTNEPPDLVILDVNLPHMSGHDILKHIRKSEKFAETPVIILTANSLMLSQIRPESTANDYLRIKPIGMKDLQDLAKSLQRGADGEMSHMAETQKVPHLDENNGEKAEEEQVKANPPQVLSPENSMIETSETLAVDPKAKTQEHKAIITPEDDIIPTEDGNKGAR